MESAILAGEGTVIAVEYNQQDRQTMEENAHKFGLNNIAIIGTVVGALFIGFSREKIEDEMIQHIRLNALMAAMWINYLLLIVVSLSIYNINYLTVMACGMATPLVIFLLVYHFNLYRLNRNLHHEE